MRICHITIPLTALHLCTTSHTLHIYTADFENHPTTTTACPSLRTTSSFTNPFTPPNDCFIRPSPALTRSILLSHRLVESLPRSNHHPTCNTTRRRLKAMEGVPLEQITINHSSSERTLADTRCRRDTRFGGGEAPTPAERRQHEVNCPHDCRVSKQQTSDIHSPTCFVYPLVHLVKHCKVEVGCQIAMSFHWDQHEVHTSTQRHPPPSITWKANKQWCARGENAHRENTLAKPLMSPPLDHIIEGEQCGFANPDGRGGGEGRGGEEREREERRASHKARLLNPLLHPLRLTPTVGDSFKVSEAGAYDVVEVKFTKTKSSKSAIGSGEQRHLTQLPATLQYLLQHEQSASFHLTIDYLASKRNPLTPWTAIAMALCSPAVRWTMDNGKWKVDKAPISTEVNSRPADHSTTPLHSSPSIALRFNQLYPSQPH
ncbi:hypothetical protein TcWFU_000464 [Taenia crassiceps]|uniref:Uncharacterized protein n=1 Tax=Taenia crassiceps TaxID=6207 RepID=A0ABR4QFM8_9CEST